MKMLEKGAKVLFGAMIAAAAPSAFAESATTEGADEYMETVTVIGTKTERKISDVAGSISVLDEEYIERQLIQDIADLVKYEPGVSVSGTGSRFGLSGFAIRGIEGNRVLTLVDGVRVPEEFSFGPFLNARRDFVSVESIRMLEISKGSGSSLYGSDALGGVVSILTRGPEDYVDSNDPTYVSYKVGYSSEDTGITNTITAAAKVSSVSGLVEYSARSANETETMGVSGFNVSAGWPGSRRQEADPMDMENTNLRLGLSMDVGERHVLSVDYEEFTGETDANILSDAGMSYRGTTTTGRTALDERTRTKTAITYRLTEDLLFVDSLVFTYYQQESENDQLTRDSRVSFMGPGTRNSFSEFDQDIEGYYGQATTNFSTGSVNHSLTYGVDYYEKESMGYRTAETFNAQGIQMPEFYAYPTRDYPITRVDQLGIFIQNEMSFMDGKLLVTPSYRYDDYDAETLPDLIWVNGHVGDDLPKDYADSAGTFQLSGLYGLNDKWSLYLRYSEGFRAPPADSVNSGFRNLIGGYKVVSNPTLTSETSSGYEGGLRYSAERMYVNLAWYQTDYEDFIEENVIAPQFLMFGGVDPSDGLLAFTTINRGEATIDGWELSARMTLSHIFNSWDTSDSGWMDNFNVRFAITGAEGKDTVSNQPIDSIEPLNGALGISYDSANGNWGAELSTVFYDGKDPDDIASATRHISSGYGVLDLTGYYNIGQRVSINVGAFNLMDKTYMRWVDTVSVGRDAPERFTQPGIHFGLNARITL